MKPNDVRRDIASRHSRTGSAPDIGRVSRLRGPDTPPPGSGRVRRSHRVNDHRQVLIHRWSIALGIAAAIVLCGAFFLWLRPMMARRVDGSSVAKQDREELVKIASKFPSPSRDEAIDIVTNALANRDPAKVAHFFRPGSASPAAIVDYCAKAEHRDGPFEDYDWISSLDAGDLLVEGVVINYKGLGDKPAQRLALLTPDDSGRWQVDFDSLARSVTPAWKDILAGTAGVAQVRVMATPGVYYNGAYRDENVWTCYNLTSPDMDVTLCGYCRIGSPEGESMKKLFNDETLTTRVAVEIRHNPDAESRQFEISRLLSRDWVVPATAPQP